MVAGQAWPPGLGALGQASQASPLPSPSESTWLALETVGQLSATLGTPSPSMSLGSTGPQELVGSNGQGSHASPRPSPSASGWAPLSMGRMGLKMPGQLS